MPAIPAIIVESEAGGLEVGCCANAGAATAKSRRLIAALVDGMVGLLEGSGLRRLTRLAPFVDQQPKHDETTPRDDREDELVAQEPFKLGHCSGGTRQRARPECHLGKTGDDRGHAEPRIPLRVT